MISQFDQDGIHFRYPGNWRLEREDQEEGWTVTLQSPSTAFMLLSLRQDMPPIEQVAEDALTALREDYPELEADDCVDSVAGQPAVGHEVHFFSLDFTNTAWTRSFYTPRGTVLLLCQSNDLEMEDNEPVLKAICASLEVEDEG
jgi:hypothetical protein